MARVRYGACRLAMTAVLAALPLATAAHAAQTTQYTYDALGRVLSAIDGNGRKVVYTYDSTGNRTRVSNGAEFQEILPTAWSASTNGGTTGLAAANGMRDGDFNALASIHATQSAAGSWIKADLGVAKTVNHIDIAPALASAVTAGPEDLNDTVVEYSTDDVNWSAAATISGMAPGAARSIALGGVSARYVQIRRAITGQVAVGDLRLFSAAVANSPLVAQPDSAASGGEQITIDVKANDQDLDGYAFTISAVEDPPHGTVVNNGGATVSYTPDPGYFGADSFFYTVSDGHNGTASARVSVLVRPSTNHAPVAVTDNFTVSDRVTALVDGTNDLRPSANDYDADGDVLTITARTNPANGTATIVGGNIIRFQPTAGYTGSDSLTYTIDDGRTLTAVGTINLNIANSSPVAAPDSIQLPKNGAVAFDAKLNDSDPNGDTITIQSLTTPTKGAATLNGDQTVTYTATAGAVGGDTFRYVLADARGATATGSVTVSISPNSAPVAVVDDLTATGSPLTFDPRGNDIDADNDPLTVVGVTQPAHGTAAIGAGGALVTYTPTGGWTGVDTFTYTVSDDEGGTSTATIAVNQLNLEYLVVAGGGGGGGADWLGSSGGGSGGGGGVLTGFTVLPPGNSLSATIGAGGTAPQSLGATPGGQGGTSSLGVVASTVGGGRGGAGAGGAGLNGGAGGSGGGGGRTDNNLYGTGGTGVAGQGFAGGASSPIQLGSGGGAGSASGGGRTSSISGSDVTYGQGGGAGNAAQGYGGGGGGASAPGNLPAPGSGGVVVVRYRGTPKATGGAITQVNGYTIHTFAAAGTFSVTSANGGPTAQGDAITTKTGLAVQFDPRVNDTDPTGDALRIVSLGAPTYGVASITNGGSTILYTPNGGASGTDSFSYTVQDTGGAPATATITVTIAANPSRVFSISPAYAGKTSWDLAVDGALNISTAGSWTITPQMTFAASTKTWGSGGGTYLIAYGGGGAGGYAAGTVTFYTGVGYELRVGGVGDSSSGAGVDYGPAGGGYSGLKRVSGAAVLVGGGGGGAMYKAGGAGGGAIGQDGVQGSADNYGRGGTQTAGGSGSGQGGGSGSAYKGGNAWVSNSPGGGGGYYGGGAGHDGGSGAGGGGGGSGYAHPTDVIAGTLVGGSGTTAGNSGDGDRGTAGNSNTSGRVRISQ